LELPESHTEPFKMAPVVIPCDQGEMTVDEATAVIGSGRAQAYLSFLTGLTYFSDIAEIFFLGYAVGQLKCTWKLTGTQVQNLISLVFVGMIFGAPVWGYLADANGRRWAFLASTAVIAMSGILAALSPSYEFLMICRFGAGFGVAGCSVAFDVLAEACDVKWRGKITMVFNIVWTLGSIYVTIFAGLFMRQEDGWRYLAAVVAFPPCLAFAFAWNQLPESPRWLVCQNRIPQAVKIMNGWARDNGKIDGAIKTLKKDENDDEGSLMEFLKDVSIRKNLALMAVIWFCFGFTYWGIMLMIPQLFVEETKKCELNFGLKGALISAAAEIVGVCVATHFLDSAGRIPVQKWGYFMSAVAILLLNFIKLPATGFSWVWLTLVASVLRGSMFAASCCSWVHTPELFPTRFRTTAHGLMNMCNRIGGSVVPHLVYGGATLRTVTLILATCIAGFAAMFLTETMGKAIGQGNTGSFSDIKATFNGKERKPSYQHISGGQPPIYPCSDATKPDHQKGGGLPTTSNENASKSSGSDSESVSNNSLGETATGEQLAHQV